MFHRLPVCGWVLLLAACASPTESGPPPLEFAEISPGAYHTCGRTADAEVYCWGANTNGELGAGMRADSPRPVLAAGGRRFISVSAGYARTCGVTEDSTTLCWGRDYGSTPVSIAGPKLAFVDLGRSDENVCGLTGAGAAYCWGPNDYGQVGNGTLDPSPTPSSVALAGPLLATGAGPAHACALAAAVTAHCWGTDAQGRTGTTAVPSSCAEGPPCRYPMPAPVLGDLLFTRLDVGYLHTCAVTDAGAGYCWGSNLYGELGATSPATCHPAVPCSPAPVAVSGGHRFASIATGAYHTCAVTVGGTGHCWGRNANGALGTGDHTDRDRPATVEGALRFRSIAPGVYHTCGITVDGRGYCWGGNNAGGLGNGTAEPTTVPVAVLAPYPLGGTPASP